MQDNQENQLVKKPKKSFADKFSTFLYKGGSLSKKGKISGAKFVAKGVEKGGCYIKSKIKTNKTATKISNGTMAKIKMAKVTTNAVFNFASTSVKGLIKMGGKIGNEMVNNFEKSEKG